jgi:1,2-diacylglycerol 3-alpha-glucosyltransferase
MNIALFSDSYLPTKSGIVTVIIQLRAALEALGHHVVVVTVETTPEAKRDEDPCIFRVPSIPLGLGTDQFVGFPHKRKIIEFLREHDIEIIHSHTEFYIAHAAKSVGKTMRIPTIVTTHTMWEDFYDFYVPMARLIPVKVIRRVVKRIYRKFYAFINVSSKAKDYFKSDFMLPHIPSAVIPNAVDTEAFLSSKDTEEDFARMRKNWNIGEKDVLLLFVGRIGEEKRVLELLDVAMRAVSARENVKALFVGNGPALEPMRQTVHKAKLDDRIVFTGFVNWTDLHTYYGMSDVFMTCSLSEMHSMTILEALLSGLPICARRDSSYLDTVYPNENGYLCDDDEGVERAILELVDDPGKRRAYGARSLEISRNFSIAKHAEKTVAFYRTVLQYYPEPVDEAVLRKNVEG